MYNDVSHGALTRPEVQAYPTYWFVDIADLTEQAGLVPTSDDVAAQNVTALESHIFGSGTAATVA